MESVDPNSLPVDKKGLKVKGLVDPKVRIIEEVVTTVEDPVSNRPKTKGESRSKKVTRKTR
jgi:hypothetical protein